MEVLIQILQSISFITSMFLLGMMGYQLLIGLFGFKKADKDYADHDPESRFLVLVPAHNEEKVISDIIRNLQQMDYPKELYDFYIIADNCTDHTADVARSLGANVIETRKESPDAPTGKPIALRKALDALGDYQNRYDLMMIFDADNLMDLNMFREVNSQYLDKDKPDFIQCYLGCKNKKGIVAWFYYSGYTLTNRFFDLAKHRLGLNCVIGGTGFAMSTEYLYSRGGWTTRSLTEDFDALTNTGRLFRAFFKGEVRLGEFLSLLTYMYSIATYVVVAIQLLLSTAISLLSTGIGIFNFSLESALYGILMFSYSYFFLFYLSDWMDNHIPFSIKTIPVMVGGFFANMIVAIFNQIVGLARWRDQQHWVKTEHAIGTETTLESNMITVPQKAR